MSERASESRKFQEGERIRVQFGWRPLEACRNSQLLGAATSKGHIAESPPESEFRSELTLKGPFNSSKAALRVEKRYKQTTKAPQDGRSAPFQFPEKPTTPTLT